MMKRHAATTCWGDDMGSGGKTTYKTVTLDPPEPLPTHAVAEPTERTAAQQSRIETAPQTSLLAEEDEQQRQRSSNLLG